MYQAIRPRTEGCPGSGLSLAPYSNYINLELQTEPASKPLKALPDPGNVGLGLTRICGGRDGQRVAHAAVLRLRIAEKARNPTTQRLESMVTLPTNQAEHPPQEPRFVFIVVSLSSSCSSLAGHAPTQHPRFGASSSHPGLPSLQRRIAQQDAA